MRRTFNMGIGLIVVCSAASAGSVLQALAAAGEPRAARIGQIVDGKKGVRYGGF